MACYGYKQMRVWWNLIMLLMQISLLISDAWKNMLRASSWVAVSCGSTMRRNSCRLVERAVDSVTFQNSSLKDVWLLFQTMLLWFLERMLQIHLIVSWQSNGIRIEASRFEKHSSFNRIRHLSFRMFSSPIPLNTTFTT